MNSRHGLVGAFTWAVGLIVTGSHAHAQVIDVTAPGNPIVGVAAILGSPTSTLSVVGTVPGANNYPAGEPPPASIDNLFGIGNSGNKYLNFQETNVGFIVTPTALSVLTGLRFSTCNDAPERDPFTISIEGTNSPNATTTLNSTWTTIYSGTSGLATDPGRNAFGSTASFTNSLSFTSYRMLVQSVRDGVAANSFQFQEIELLALVPEPSSLILGGLGVSAAMCRWRRRKCPSTL
jgi:hypothetical protein